MHVVIIQSFTIEHCGGPPSGYINKFMAVYYSFCCRRYRATSVAFISLKISDRTLKMWRPEEIKKAPSPSRKYCRIKI